MNKKVFFIILTLGFLITQVFPLIGFIFPIGNIWNLFVFVGLSLLLYPNLFLHKTIVALIIYGALTLVFCFTGNAYFHPIQAVISPLLCMLASIIIFEYSLTYDKDLKYTKAVVFTIIGLNAVMAIISIPQLITNPNLIRALDSGIASKIYSITTFQTLHGLPLLFASLVFLIRRLYKNFKFGSLLLLAITVSFFLLEAYANAALAFFVSVLMVLLSLVFNIERFTRKSVLYIIVVFVSCFILIRPLVIVSIIDTAQNIMPKHGATMDRLQEIKYNLQYGESMGDLELRQDLYTQSQSLFWESPLLGTEYPEYISRHAWIWDHLAALGIILIIPLVLVFVFHIKRAYNSLKYSKVPYTIGLVALFMLLYYKNEFEIGTWLYAFTALPLLNRYTDNIIEKNNTCIKL